MCLMRHLPRVESVQGPRTVGDWLLPSSKTEGLRLRKDPETYRRFPRFSGLPATSPFQDSGVLPVPTRALPPPRETP